MKLISSKQFRFGQLLNERTGKAIVVAMDHPGGGNFPGLEDFEKTLKRVIAAQPDGIMLNVAMMRHFNHLFKGKAAPAIIAAIDLNMLTEKLSRELMEEGQNLEVASVEEAIRHGATAVKVLMTWGQVDLRLQHHAFERIGIWAEKCAYWNIPFIIEPNLWGRKIGKEMYKDKTLLADTARIAVEMGADILKMDAPEDVSDLKEIVKLCMIPVFLLGGAKYGDAESFLQKVDQAIEAGAAGVVAGRSVWQAKDINAMIEALRLVVHERKLSDGLKIAFEAY